MKIKVFASSSVTSFGVEPEDFWEACVQEKSSFEDGLSYIPEKIRAEVKDKVSGKLREPIFAGMETNPILQWTLYCLQESMHKAGVSQLGPKDGVILATTTGLTHFWEGRLMNHLRVKTVETDLYQPIGAFGAEIKNQMQHPGPIQIVSSACAAGTQAMGLARGWLRAGFVDRCFVLGAEQICQLTDRGFRSLSLVSGEDCFPFNENHNNICLSEAAACLCLTLDDADRGVFLTGFGCSSDAHSMTAPRPDGSGPYESMTLASLEAGIRPSEIGWIHAHGTGSIQNDRAEAAAIFQINKDTPVTSTKKVHGHSLAASGVLESLLCIAALEKQEVLSTPGCELGHFNVNICTRHESRPLRHVLKNTLGFGGINSSLVFSIQGAGNA